MFSFYSFAHHCRSESGHPFSYHCSCQDAINNLNGIFHAYVHEECTISPLPPGWMKWFPSISNQKKKRLFAKRCHQIFKQPLKQPKEKRIFFLENFGRRDLRLFVLAALFNGRKHDSIWILFRDDHIWKRRRDRFEVFVSQKLLRFKFGKRMQFLSDSTTIASYLEKELSQPFHVMPLPHIDFPPTPFKIPTTYNLCFLGEPRKEKGLHQVLRLIKSSDPKADLFTLTLSEAIPIEDAMLPIITHPIVLSRMHYLKTIQEADIMLLPYSPHRYRRRTSGIFIEAIWMGKIPLVQEKTWLADELLKYDLKELIVDWNDHHFFSNLLKTLSSPLPYEKLSKMQHAYTRCHAFDAFSKKMEELIKGP